MRNSRRARGLPVGGARVPAKLRLEVLKRDGYACHWCGCLGDTVDHVVPLARGGKSEASNLVCACRRCNYARQDRLPGEGKR